MKLNFTTVTYLTIFIFAITLAGCNPTSPGPAVTESDAMDAELSTQTELSTSTDVDTLEAELDETMILEDDFSDLE